MRIVPLAADSLGARSMATLVETPDVRIVIDPGVRLAPWRYELPPHPQEEERRRELWRRTRDATRKADVLTVSHYHFDHHEPDAPSIFRGKVAFLKDGTVHINRSQRERARAFTKALKGYPREVHVADGNHADFGGTEIAFSPALPHGPNDELGCVVMVRVARGDEVFVHTADVLGSPLKAHTAFLLEADPTVLYVDGPMLHGPEEISEEPTKRSLANLQRIVRSTDVRTVILDHHLLRDRGWREHMASLFETAEEHDVALRTAAGFLGQEEEPLEANRDVLYGLRPSTQRL